MGWSVPRFASCSVRWASKLSGTLVTCNIYVYRREGGADSLHPYQLQEWEEREINIRATKYQV